MKNIIRVCVGGQNAPAVATYACDVFLKAWNGAN